MGEDDMALYEAFDLVPYEIYNEHGDRLIYTPQERWVTPNFLAPVMEKGNRQERRKARVLLRR